MSVLASNQNVKITPEQVYWWVKKSLLEVNI